MEKTGKSFKENNLETYESPINNRQYLIEKREKEKNQANHQNTHTQKPTKLTKKTPHHTDSGSSKTKQ